MVGSNSKKTFLKALLYMLPALIIITIFVIYPLFHTVRMSFYSADNNLFTIIKGEANGWSLRGYKLVLDDPLFIRAIKNTFIYTLFTVPISLVLALLVALLLNSKIKASKFFQTVYFLPYVTNAIAIGLAFQFIFHSDYGILNMLLNLVGIDAIQWLNDPNYSMFALIIFGIWGGMAFKIVIFLSGLQGVDKQLYQAARIDEASVWSQFKNVTVPQLAPIIAYQLVIGIIGSFKVYIQVVGLFGDAGPSDSAITMVYYLFEQFYNVHDYITAAASGVIMFIIIMAFTFIQMRLSNKQTN